MDLSLSEEQEQLVGAFSAHRFEGGHAANSSGY